MIIHHYLINLKTQCYINYYCIKHAPLTSTHYTTRLHTPGKHQCMNREQTKLCCPHIIFMDRESMLE